MTDLTCLTVTGPEASSLAALADWAARPYKLTPGDSALADTLERLSRALFDDPRAMASPDAVALAFWLRKSPILSLTRTMLAPRSDGALRVARGVTLHFPPTNVDTLFVYSWALSFLAGNRAIVRLSERAGPLTALLAGHLLTVLADAPPAVAQSTRLITYARNAETSAALSALCDLRVIWGGNASIAALQAIPLPPHARDLTFPDRTSLAALSVPAVAALDEADLNTLAESFYNDAFLFDQMACSSPRLIAWVGTDETAVAARFYKALSQVATARGYTPAWGTILEKRTQAAEALVAGRARACRMTDPALTVIDLKALSGHQPRATGGGLFDHIRIDSLNDLLSTLSRHNQTLAVFGFKTDVLEEFVRAAGPRSPDRIVPVGQALTFGNLWDGHDLVHEFTRLVAIQTPRGHSDKHAD